MVSLSLCLQAIALDAVAVSWLVAGARGVSVLTAAATAGFATGAVVGWHASQKDADARALWHWALFTLATMAVTAVYLLTQPDSWEAAVWVFDTTLYVGFVVGQDDRARLRRAHALKAPPAGGDHVSLRGGASSKAEDVQGPDGTRRDRLPADGG